MNVTLSQISKVHALSKAQLLAIQDDEFDYQILDQRELILKKVIEWAKSNVNKSKIQNLIRSYIHYKKDFNTIFKPLSVLVLSHGVYISQFLDPNILRDVLLIKIANSNNIVVPYRNPDLLIEGYIGIILNKLRDKIINFVFTYAVFQCGVPVETNNKQYKWCSRRGINDYVITEYLEGSKELVQYIYHCNKTKLMIILLQIACALRLAKITCNFSHNDLWASNVLIQDLTTPVNVKIYTPNGIKIIKTDIIATIIDFGFSGATDESGTSIGIFNVSKGENLGNLQITEDFHYLITDLYRELNIDTKSFESLNIEISGNSGEEYSQSEARKRKEFKNNVKECTNLLNDIYQYYSDEKLYYYFRFMPDIMKYRRIPRVTNEIKVFDEIINGMIGMNLVKLYNLP